MGSIFFIGICIFVYCVLYGRKDYITINNIPDKAVFEPIKEVAPIKKQFAPETFDQYVGQDKAKDLLNAYIEGTTNSDKVIDHMLIHGLSGCGKTTLARCFIKEFRKADNRPNINQYECIAKSIKNIEEIVNAIRRLDGGFFIMDESHGLKEYIVEQLYTIMTDFNYNGEQLKPFTFIGCTTEYGYMLEKYEPFVQRFGLPIQLDNYTEDNIKQILKGVLENNYSDIEGDKEYIFNTIVKNCRLTPRIAINHLKSCYFMKGNIDKALWAKNIIYNGYTKDDYNILKYLKNSGKAGVQAICAYLGTSAKNYNIKEGFLLRNELIVRASRGRSLTDNGRELLTLLENKIVKEKG